MMWALLVLLVLLVLCVLQVQGQVDYSFTVPQLLSVASGGDFNGDGFEDICLVSRGGYNGKTNNGIFYIVFGGAQDPDYVDIDDYVAEERAIQIFGGQNNAGTGAMRCAFAGDVNGDGYDDVVVAQTSANAVYVVYGSTVTNSAIDLARFGASSETRGIVISGQDGILFGTSVKSAGDVNQDSYTDILIVAQRSIYLLYGSASLPSALSATNPTYVTTLSITFPSTPFDVQGLDFNRDSFSDIAFTVVDASASSSVLYVILGSRSLPTSLSESNAMATNLRFTGTTPSLSCADMNGDGFDEILVLGENAERIAFYKPASAVFDIVEIRNVAARAVSGTSKTAQASGGGAFGAAVFANDTAVVVVFGRADLPAVIDSPYLANETHGFVVPFLSTSASVLPPSVASGDTNNDGIAEVMLVPPDLGRLDVIRQGGNACACSPNATCVQNATTGTFECTCPIGYSLPNCTVMDDCSAQKNCSEYATCNNTTMYECECRPGFSGDGFNCTDTDECGPNVCPTNAICVNFLGGYNCSCPSGFFADASANNSCVDVNECTAANSTVQCQTGWHCVNTPGSHYCAYAGKVSKNEELSGGAIAGIVVGVIIGGVILVLLVGLFFHLFRNRMANSGSLELTGR